MLSITPGMIVRYYENCDPHRRSYPKMTSMANLKLNMQPHEMSDKTRKKIRRAVNWMVAITDEKLYTPPGKQYSMYVKIAFVTVTLPAMQKHCDKVITKECLNHLLTELRQHHGVRNYVWKAEAQENGNLHYHIAIDTPINHTQLRKRWNRIISKLGYMDDFHDKYGHRNPNSTDVHKVKDVENVAAYISEYMAKKESKRPVCGRVWGCSQTISRCRSVKLVEEDEIYDEVVKIEGMKEVKAKQMDYCRLLFMATDVWNGGSTPTLAREWNEYVQLAKSDQLESPSKKKISNVPDNEVIDISEAMIVKVVAHEMKSQVDQMRLMFTFDESDNDNDNLIRVESNGSTLYRGSGKDIYTDNRRAKELLSHRPTYNN